jgi:pimeloyl-ACP methyl ester carboxylesterase
MEAAQIQISDAVLGAIAARVADAHIGYAPDDDNDWKYGVDAVWLADLKDHWVNRYDWRDAERQFNRFEAYATTIDDISIHFFRVREKDGGFPLILTHGWPGSVFEFLAAAPLLARQGFDVILPSLPGYGFSGRPLRPIGPAAVARIWRKLMTDGLGFTRFGAQGGDWGSFVTASLGREHADVVSSIHLNMYQHRPVGAISAEVADYQTRLASVLAVDGAYAAMQGTRPQTIGLALADSPLGFAGWISEKCRAWSDCDGDLEAVFSKDDLITNAMTYLVSANVQSAIWMYHGFGTEALDPRRIEVPCGFAEFPKEFIPAPPAAAMQSDMNLVHRTAMARGGHFGAWEQPQAFADEVGSFFSKWQ